jgi:hypothetical protein
MQYLQLYLFVQQTADALIKLRLEIKAGDYKKSSTTPCFYIIGRVRMRMGFNWSVATRETLVPIFSEKDDEALQKLTSFVRAATCSVCSKPQYDKPNYRDR